MTVKYEIVKYEIVKNLQTLNAHARMFTSKYTQRIHCYSPQFPSI